ncbi:MAG TPA: fatty acid desaturase, partial [Alphaproteobacteria bacterium]|nr:fatty acid desaturase [Alphaproteobacteria bacterium]
MDIAAQRDLIKRINAFSQPSNKTAFFELGATLGLCLLLCALMVWSMTLGGWGYLTLTALPVAGILQTRLFTIQHDCGHGAYFTTKFLNERVGEALGVLTWTPYHYWRRTHSAHHAYSGNLDHRGIGDVDTLTVKEYQALPPLKRAYYRMYRHPVFILLGAPILLFALKHRLPLDNPFHSFKTWTSIMMTNAGIAFLAFMIIFFFGWKAFVFVYLPVC